MNKLDWPLNHFLVAKQIKLILADCRLECFGVSYQAQVCEEVAEV